MRNNRAIDVLIPGVRQKILGLLLLHPQKWWFLSDLARDLGLSPSSLQRHLSALVQVDILRRKTEGKQVYFQANAEHLIFPELREIFMKTAGLADVLAKALKKVEKTIQIAFVFGSVAEKTETSESDIDLMIVGNITPIRISPELRAASERLRRPIHSTVFSENEFRGKLKENNHFLRKILRKDKIFVIGNEKDLETFTR